MFLYYLRIMTLNPEIWGPKYWFFLYTVALTYPLSPNDVSKKNIMILFKIFRYLYQIWK